MSGINEIGQKFNIIKKISQTFFTTSILNMWFKLKSGTSLSLTDVNELIPSRWPFFKDEWEKIKKSKYESKVDTYSDPDKLRVQIESFSNFIEFQRNFGKNRNPFTRNDIVLRFYTIFDVTLVNDLPLSNEETYTLTNKINTVSNFNRSDFVGLRRDLVDQRDALTDYVNASDPDYNRIHGRQSTTGQVEINTYYVSCMYHIQSTINAIDFILANDFALDNAFIDPFALARLNANNPEIDISSYGSGVLTRLNYGESLQQLADRAMGDPSKWIEIAIANGLKPPYIDETGEKINLIANAEGNRVNIPATDTGGNLNSDKISTNQIVLLQSDIQNSPEQRIIVNIREAPISGELIIELDGDPNLDKYKLNENAYIRIFKQNTVNSSLFILIPNSDIVNTDNKAPWFMQKSTAAEKYQKIDLYLDDNNDLVFGSNKDLALSYGINNSIQAIKIKMSTEIGELVRHSGFGFPNFTGRINQDLTTIQNEMVGAINSMILNDDRFSRIETISTLARSNAILVNFSVRLMGSNQIVPISFSVNIM